MEEYTLSLFPDIEAQLAQYLTILKDVTKVRKMARILRKCKQLMLSLEFVETDEKMAFIKSSLLTFGIKESEWSLAWTSIKKVWASKFNERAFIATKKINVTLGDVYMAVLVQKIIPAEYAYVIHTANPTNGEEDEVYSEACRGLGESLVGDAPGQGLSFTYHKTTKQVKVNSYPNKPIGLGATGFIFRSDSNSEDLPGFAGAGLFDSFPMTSTEKYRVSYHKE